MLGRGCDFAATADGLAGLSAVSGGEGAVVQLTKKLKTIGKRQDGFISGLADPVEKMVFLLAVTPYASLGRPLPRYRCLRRSRVRTGPGLW